MRINRRQPPRGNWQVTTWLNAHKEEMAKHRGEWVAVAPEGLVAFGEDFDVIADAARDHKPEQAVVFKMPIPRPGVWRV